MKTIIIVLLVAALGAGAYFYFTKSSKPSSTNSEKLILGRWKIDSLDLSKTKDSSLNVIALILAARDSNLHNYNFEFTKGQIIQSLNGKSEDTSYYQFANEKQLLTWKKNDSLRSKMNINKLDSLNFVVQAEDSSVFSFIKVK